MNGRMSRSNGLQADNFELYLNIDQAHPRCMSYNFAYISRTKTKFGESGYSGLEVADEGLDLYYVLFWKEEKNYFYVNFRCNP
jgi:hypothetical protein